MTANASDALIDMRDVRLSLGAAGGTVDILRGVTFRVSAGETVSVVGPSGSGKTTMLMVLAGLEHPSSGEITVAGHRLATLGEDALARFRSAHVGVVFQAFHLVPTMTALENVALPLEFSRRPDAAARAAQCLDEVGLSARARHYPSQLSGGEQQRVAIARAFAPEPPLLLADEPTGNLDAATGQRIMDLLFSLRERFGTTLVLVTHDERLAARCSRTVRMADGKLNGGVP
ncbi:putative ABC transport system ATP-binding protein [Desulfobaculum xiamenense]|uniref:Putative ABC transport system ATP-binding protein n=1 Tax=Desulfobaculum xiamenense TaxID=995050 RepID=A0A846QLG7_9BACT|nr:ABC transporter ATP-binding protein [Desulfobaculum xiamenense]NJB67890.1 putative ABC transport system ATP-binding protein [Desulfobaculum xiamenense]